MTKTQIDVTHYDMSRIHKAGGDMVEIKAGNRGTKRIVPRLGRAFERQEWARHVEVYVSKTGRSVRVFVDGEEIKR